MPTKREMLLKRKFPKAFREDTIAGNTGISHEEQKFIDDQAQIYWQELQEKSDEEIELIIAEQDKKRLSEYEANNPVPSREEIYRNLKPIGITCPEGVYSKAAIKLFGYKKFGAFARQKRIDDVLPDFIELLITTPELEIFTIGSYDGKRAEINRDYLRSNSAYKELVKGFIPYMYNSPSDTHGNYIFINKAQFESILDDKPIVVNSKDDIPDTASSHKYTPPYIEFMLKASKDLNLSHDKKANLEDIISWLNDNWPANLDGKSDVLIKYMATLLRRPEDKKGGNSSWKKR